MFRKILSISFVCLLMTSCTTITRRGDGGEKYQPLDATIQSNLNIEFLKLDSALYYQLSIKIYKGRVLFAGRVPSSELKNKMVEIAKKTPGVLEVYDHTTIGSSRDATDYLSDSWISTKLAGQIFTSSELLPDHYLVDVVDGTVFILGQARSPEERGVVTDLARNIRGVKKVYCYVSIEP